MFRKILYTLIILTGISLLLYPWISNWLYQSQADSEVNVYHEKVEQMGDAEKEAELKRAEDYNRNLNQAQVTLTDTFIADQQQEAEGLEYDSLLNLSGNGMMGYIEIPTISVNLPVYHGTAASTLETGVGHLEGSSLPVGGEGTHAVLTGHTGLNKAKLFTDLTEVKKGDLFFLHVSGRDMAYEVNEIKIIEPEDISTLLVRPGEDLVTLVTCTPYGVNTHRLCVTGTRTEYTEDIHRTVMDKGSSVKDSIWMRTYRKAVIVGIVLSVGIILMIRLVQKRRR